jgi:hypothetical protein
VHVVAVEDCVRFLRDNREGEGKNSRLSRLGTYEDFPIVLCILAYG